MDTNGMTDAEKLRYVADWFDADDRRKGRAGHSDVQNDLRRIADRVQDLDEFVGSFVNIAGRSERP